MIKQRDGWVKIPLGVLERTNPLGGVSGFDAKRPFKCAMPCCKTQGFFDCYCVLTSRWRNRREGLAAPVVVCFTVPTIPVSHVVA